jgi:hypothetical protein
LQCVLSASPKEHQDLARHSTHALTSRYTHSRFYDLAAADRSLPIPTGAPHGEAGALAATGTEGSGKQWETGPKTLAQILARDRLLWAISRDKLRRKTRDRFDKKNPGKHAVSAAFQVPIVDLKEWRTGDLNP